MIAMMSLEQIHQVNEASEQASNVERLVVDLPPKVKIARIHPVARAAGSTGASLSGSPRTQLIGQEESDAVPRPH